MAPGGAAGDPSGEHPVTTSARLSAAFADPYHLERVVGRGGMATVDPAEGRKSPKVALGVPKAERATVVSAEEHRPGSGAAAHR